MKFDLPAQADWRLGRGNEEVRGYVDRFEFGPLDRDARASAPPMHSEIAQAAYYARLDAGRPEGRDEERRPEAARKKAATLLRVPFVGCSKSQSGMVNIGRLFPRLQRRLQLEAWIVAITKRPTDAGSASRLRR